MPHASPFPFCLAGTIAATVAPTHPPHTPSHSRAWTEVLSWVQQLSFNSAAPLHTITHRPAPAPLGYCDRYCVRYFRSTHNGSSVTHTMQEHVDPATIQSLICMRVGPVRFDPIPTHTPCPEQAVADRRLEGSVRACERRTQQPSDSIDLGDRPIPVVDVGTTT